MILLIDDEKRRMRTSLEYLRELKYDVKFIDNVDGAFDYIDKNQNNLEVIILDIMMPWGTLFNKEETEFGLLSGYKLLYKIRKDFGDKIPIIIYTALNREKVLLELKKIQNCYVYKKSESSIGVIADKIKDIMNV